jgi:hypothetical protein
MNIKKMCVVPCYAEHAAGEPLEPGGHRAIDSISTDDPLLSSASALRLRVVVPAAAGFACARGL